MKESKGAQEIQNIKRLMENANKNIKPLITESQERIFPGNPNFNDKPFTAYSITGEHYGSDGYATKEELIADMQRLGIENYNVYDANSDW